MLSTAQSSHPNKYKEQAGCNETCKATKGRGGGGAGGEGRVGRRAGVRGGGARGGEERRVAQRKTSHFKVIRGPAVQTLDCSVPETPSIISSGALSLFRPDRNSTCLLALCLHSLPCLLLFSLYWPRCQCCSQFSFPYLFHAGLSFHRKRGFAYVSASFLPVPISACVLRPV